MLKSKIASYHFLAEPFHCDFSNHLFMGHLGNHLLNAAEFHAEERGFGFNYLSSCHKAWVLSRLVIDMNEMPMASTEFVVKTWVENAVRYFTARNFAITGTDGQQYGYARSMWAMIDTETRQPSDIFSINEGGIKNYIETEEPCPIAKASRVNMGEDAQLVSTISTHYSDVDINGHINSVKYIEHILDVFPISWYKAHALRRIDVAYVAEAHGGDTLTFYQEQCDNMEYNIRVMRQSEHDESEVEVVRAKIVFTEK